MKFGPVPIANARGSVLAHSLTVDGQRLRKGKVLRDEDLAALVRAGVDEVIVAQLDATDLDEDRAAAQIAAAMVPDPKSAHLRLTQATTGRVNVYGMGPGVLDLDTDAIDAANRVDPMITIATLPPYAVTRARGLVATVKVISYGVAADLVAEASQRVAGAIVARPAILKNAVLIQTDIGAGPGKGADAMQARLTALGMEMTDSVCVPHAVAPLQQAIVQAKADLVLILTASATSDLHDVAPQAVRAASGNVTRFGMPVDPGNLLFIGDQAGRPVIGLPGCARSPALNGADWVLERVACGIEVRDDDISRMGVGGLLKESPARPFPRESRR